MNQTQRRFDRFLAIVAFLALGKLKVPRGLLKNPAGKCMTRHKVIILLGIW